MQKGFHVTRAQKFFCIYTFFPLTRTTTATNNAQPYRSPTHEQRNTCPYARFYYLLIDSLILKLFYELAKKILHWTRDITPKRVTSGPISTA